MAKLIRDLMVAISENMHYRVIEALINNVDDVNHGYDHNDNPLLAILTRKYPKTTLEALLKKGAHVNFEYYKNGIMRIPLLESLNSDENLGFAKTIMLIKYGARVSLLKDHLNDSQKKVLGEILTDELKKGDMDFNLFKDFVDLFGVDFHLKFFGKIIFCVLGRNYNRKFVRYLLEKGADPNEKFNDIDIYKNPEYTTPLMFAAQQLNLGSYKTLLSYGADPSILSKSGKDIEFWINHEIKYNQNENSISKEDFLAYLKEPSMEFSFDFSDGYCVKNSNSILDLKDIIQNIVDKKPFNEGLTIKIGCLTSSIKLTFIEDDVIFDTWGFKPCMKIKFDLIKQRKTVLQILNDLNKKIAYSHDQ